MEQKKKIRKVVRASFSKAANELEQLLSIEVPDQRRIKVQWEICQQKFEDLKVIDSEIYDLVVDTSEDDLLTEIEGCDNYRKRMLDLNFCCESLIQQANMSVYEDRQSIASQGTGRRKFKLPTIEFKKFDGNIKDWLSFWSQFKKIHEDPDIDLDDKIEYLRQATISGSRARQLVESFPSTGENYNKIIQCMLSRFGREDLQIEVYVRELLKLILNNTNSNNVDISLLYDKIETQLRALETLGVGSDKCSAMLFPLIESCLPAELLRVWQRSSVFTETGDSSVISLETRLKYLMNFLKNEVENEQRIDLAAEGFGFGKFNKVNNFSGDKKGKSRFAQPNTATASGLMNLSTDKCIFCDNNHESVNCFKAQRLPLEQKKNILSDKRACFRCLKIGHQSKKCRGRFKCVICSKSHVAVMCPELKNQYSESTEKSMIKTKTESTEHSLTNCSSTHVFLQTLRVSLFSNRGVRSVRALMDTGSQRSYILKSTANQLELVPKRKEKIIHGLFGGSEVAQTHNCYNIKIGYERYSREIEVLDQVKICGNVSNVFDGPWMEELNGLGVVLQDTSEGPIELLIGSDVAGDLFTGRTHILNCGLVAIETFLGWTLMGKIPLPEVRSSLTMTSLSLLVRDSAIAHLWELDVLGITDPIERKSREDLAQAAKELFLQTVHVNDEKRYEVRLPWLEGHPPLPSNYHIAKKRLKSTSEKLENGDLIGRYGKIFEEWLVDGVIEQVPKNNTCEKVHYLPHRPVIKESSSTTKIRPVFDASAREKNKPSLNQCLEKGPNLIELIPSILMRFRKSRIGVASDIKKAFLQISIHPADRDFLRFLWIDSNGDEKIYRHKRVVFGINSSPFLLGATLEHHLEETMKKCELGTVAYSCNTVSKLAKSFYVDNCVTSVPNEQDLNNFILESSMLMAEVMFDLRGWEYSYQCHGLRSNADSSLLGLTWNTNHDTLRLNSEFLADLEQILSKPLTKRIMLSITQRIFDPIGFTSPTTLIPKILLQKTWTQKLGWDSSVDPGTESCFRQWISELRYLLGIELPRWINAGADEAECLTLHTFCDASKDAYSTVVFLRGVRAGTVFVHLLGAKARVAPLKKITIPRLELLAAVIGSRLFAIIKQDIELDLKCFFWSDSSTALSWIHRHEEWGTFVGNRVAEIRRLTSGGEWRHVPGVLNPADKPSRGCFAKNLVESKWWEGPHWLHEEPHLWPMEYVSYDEEEINHEKKKTVVTTLLNAQSYASHFDWHLGYFSKYLKTVRMIAWVFRFINNVRRNDKRKGELSLEEIDAAENFLFKLVQSDSFTGESGNKLNTLNPFKDKNGVIRLKSQVSNKTDSENFRFPVVLPARHPVVNRLIFDEHMRGCHVGTQGLMSILRENYWILGGRRSIKSAISKCVVCKRHNSRPFGVSAPPLPQDRVREAIAFEITGVDFAGPIYLRAGEKAWICLFTCAVYRAVHLELCTSLSVNHFMQALRRFISRRGRPKTIYSDNGTNFVGTENTFKRLDWSKIVANSGIYRISWRFNPPTASWWGGFWERMVGILKQLLRKVLAKASLDYEDMLTVLCDCEAIINSRPLTYVADDPREPVPLTPAMFLKESPGVGVADCDTVDRQSLCKKIQYRQKLIEDLRKRFRNEYLGQLKIFYKKASNQKISLGDVVLIGNDNDKRISWPLGRVTELIPGKDGQIRLVRVSTARGQLLRPIQRLYGMECTDSQPLLPHIPSSVLPEGRADDIPQSDDNNDDHTEDSLSECSRTEVYKSRAPESNECGSRSGVSKSRAPESRVSVSRIGREIKPPKRFL